MMKTPIFRSRRLAIIKSSMSKLKSQLKLLEGNEGAINNERCTITRDMLQTQEGSRERFYIPTEQEISSSTKLLLSGYEKNEIGEDPKACMEKIASDQIDIGEVEENVKYDTDPEEIKEELEEEEEFHDCDEFFIITAEVHHNHFEDLNTNMETSNLLDNSYRNNIEGYEAVGDEDCDEESISASECEKKVLVPFFDNKEKTSEEDLIMQGVEPESGLKNGSDCSIGTFILVIILMLVGPYIILELNACLGTGISA